MKRYALLSLMAFSLALNLGGIATFAYYRYQNRHEARRQSHPPPPRLSEFLAHLSLEPEQRRIINRLLSEHLHRMGQRHQEIRQRRQALLVLMRQGQAAWPDLRVKVKEVSDLQCQLETEAVRFGLEVQENLRPEQRTAFLSYLERRIFPPPGGRQGGQPGLGRRMKGVRSDMPDSRER